MSKSSSCWRVLPLEHCDRSMFGNLLLTSPHPNPSPNFQNSIQQIPVRLKLRTSSLDCQWDDNDQKRRASDLMEQLLVDIYNNIHHPTVSDYNSSHYSLIGDIQHLEKKDLLELRKLYHNMKQHVERTGATLIRRLKRRDALRHQQDAHCDVITFQLVKRCAEEGGSSQLRFSIQPAPGESGFAQWAAAMKMVAQLSGGIPVEFRRRLWLTLADRHLAARKVDWARVERDCFSEWSHPADSELGVQIVKDLHRTGCSLFCGEDGVENQALLKKVLLAYARWNKAVGYCQGFNMLAALLLQVTEKSETDALKLMIYLIEGVLPDSYFADSLRGLSVDMAVFRELLRARLPNLSKHLDTLQNAAKDGTTSYEPPLTNVFTMQWFLTLFCNCLPQPTVLRVWDLIMLEGNEILLRTALAIWQTLAARILTVKSADEFYCMMGVLTRELLEFDLIDGNSLIKSVVAIGPLHELKSLREHYLYNINPWGSASLPLNADRQVNVYPAAKDRLVLDISALKKQYVKLKQRQRQAHIIFSAAISRQPPPSTPVAMNHLLLGKSALVPAKRLGPPKPGTIPPARTLLWKDAPARRPSDSSSSSDTELCDDPSDSSSEDEAASAPKASQFLDDNPVDLMINDNISLIDNDDVKICDFVANSTSSSQISDNIFDKPVAGKNEDLMFNESEDDNDSVDFEKFLQDRVSYFKKDDEEEEEEETEQKTPQGRRNSERALQIIQENSLILHRIMQCQSRLSPPIVDSDNEPEPEADASPIQDSTQYESKLEQEQDKSPEYGSRYTDILEKSKNLDEKYNSLILNSVVKVRPNELKSEEAATGVTETFDLIKLDDSEKQIKNDGIDNSPIPSPKKSPSQVFNPFPVALSSRQHKEVPLKLGLYKK